MSKNNNKKTNTNSTNAESSGFSINFDFPIGRKYSDSTPEDINETIFIHSGFYLESLLYAISVISFEYQNSDERKAHRALVNTDFLALLALGCLEKMREQYYDLKELTGGQKSE